MARDDVRCKTSSRYHAPPLKNESSDPPISNLSQYVVIWGHVTSPFSALPAPGNLACQGATTYKHQVCVCFVEGDFFFVWTSGRAAPAGGTRHDNIYYMISMYNMILSNYRAQGLPPEHPECSRYLQNTATSWVRLANALHLL